MNIFSGGLISHCLVFLALIGCTAQNDKNETKISKTEMSRDQYLEWFYNAKFGMFIHWGPYSPLAGEWNGNQIQVGRNAEWIMKFLNIPVDEYRELAHNMNPVNFDAHKWMKLAKVTGMKYIVITAKH